MRIEITIDAISGGKDDLDLGKYGLKMADANRARERPGSSRV